MTTGCTEQGGEKVLQQNNTHIDVEMRRGHQGASAMTTKMLIQ